MRVAAATATTSNVVALGLVVLAGMPAVLIRAGIVLVPVEAETLAFGLGIVSAAFAMSWGAEAAERDVPRAFRTHRGCPARRPAGVRRGCRSGLEGWSGPRLRTLRRREHDR